MGRQKTVKAADIKIGDKFGSWTAIENLYTYDKTIKVNCKCECGVVKKVAVASLIKGKSKSCGCVKIALRFKDITGQRFGRLVAVKRLTAKECKIAHAKWECKCDCGNTTKVQLTNLIYSDNTKSCECLHMEEFRKENESFIGKRFGRLTVIEYLGVDRSSNKKHKRISRFRCRCDCGKEVTTSRSSLLTRYKRSCGCLRRHNAVNLSTIESLGEQFDPWYKEFCVYLHRAKIRSYEFKLSFEEFYDICNRPCAYCGMYPRCSYTHFNRYLKYKVAKKDPYRAFNKIIFKNGIDRVDNTKGYRLDNIVPCCEDCNVMKASLHLTYFKEKIKSMYENLVLPNLTENDIIYKKENNNE